MAQEHPTEQYLLRQLHKRDAGGLLRTLTLPNQHTDFLSNDYLGLAAVEHQNTFATGATGSRLLSGNSALAQNTEAAIARFHHAEAALVFNSGYDANLGFFSSVADKNALYVYDSHIHASIVDGMRLSFAKKVKFAHNNLEDLEKKLRLPISNKIVVTESVFSMDGDLAPLAEIVDLCKHYQALLVVDEAHATGIFGPNGEGLCVAMNLHKDVFARIFTFGKALGCHGAAVAGSNTLVRFLINYARSFVYTTALPPAAFAAIQQAYLQLPLANRKQLFENIYHFNKLAINTLNSTANNSPIQYIGVAGNSKAKELENKLQENGIKAKAILSPTVAAGSERIRICLHSFNTQQEITHLFDTLEK